MDQRLITMTIDKAKHLIKWAWRWSLWMATSWLSFAWQLESDFNMRKWQ
jgi:NADH:ubiquinone oxidoreductase subunit B-like Fe-S oxidoreductase